MKRQAVFEQKKIWFLVSNLIYFLLIKIIIIYQLKIEKKRSFSPTINN